MTRSCDSYGYLGMKAKTIKAIRSWIRTGIVPAGVSEYGKFRTMTQARSEAVIAWPA